MVIDVAWMKTVYFNFGVFLALSLPTAWAESIQLVIDNHVITAEVAHTPESRSKGLMQRTSLCPDCGMLFVFNKPYQHGFWMRDTPLPLSIAFIADDGTIINIEEMQPFSRDIHRAQKAALFALEMNRNWFTKNKILPGAFIQGLDQAPSSQ